MGKTELKPCPFCGGIGEIKSGKAYYIDCVYAHCTECGVSTPKVPINHLFYTKGKNVRLSEEQAKERATNDWNRREQSEGEWIDHSEIGTMNCSWECSGCHWTTVSFTEMKHSKYCPNCGAKMKGE